MPLIATVCSQEGLDCHLTHCPWSFSDGLITKA
jgi:hypothetical protein